MYLEIKQKPKTKTSNFIVLCGMEYIGFFVASVFENLAYDKHSRYILVVCSCLTVILDKFLQEDFSAGRCLVEVLKRGPKNLQVYYQQELVWLYLIVFFFDNFVL